MNQEQFKRDLTGGSIVLSRPVFHQNQEIFHEGSVGTEAYIVESGRVEVSRMVNGEKFVLGMLGPRALFGEMAALDESPRMATITAVEPTVCIELSRTKLMAELEKSPKFIQAIVRLLLNNMRENSARMLDEIGGETVDESGEELAAAK